MQPAGPRSASRKWDTNRERTILERIKARRGFNLKKKPDEEVGWACVKMLIIHVTKKKEEETVIPLSRNGGSRRSFQRQQAPRAMIGSGTIQNHNWTRTDEKGFKRLKQNLAAKSNNMATGELSSRQVTIHEKNKNTSGRCASNTRWGEFQAKEKERPDVKVMPVKFRIEDGGGSKDLLNSLKGGQKRGHQTGKGRSDRTGKVNGPQTLCRACTELTVDQDGHGRGGNGLVGGDLWQGVTWGRGERTGGGKRQTLT